MEKTIFYINIIISFLAYIFGGFDYPFISLMLVILLDYITGILKAIYKKNLNSSLGRKGIIKKFGYLFIVILATLFDRLINDQTMAIRTLVIYFFFSNEAISILENWGALGLPLPKRLYEVFEKLKKE